MGRNDRCGKRKKRSETRKIRTPKLGYYLIVTDTEATEKNYLEGLRKSLPENIRRNIVIKVIKADTCDLVSTCISESDRLPQFSERWIVFDRDQVKNFDEIIQHAYEQGIYVGWSNPCIEIWFFAYFGKMPNVSNSVECCKRFAEIFKKKIGTVYRKADENIYSKLVKGGNEDIAFDIAEKKRKSCLQNCGSKPSDMCPCTTLDLLIKEIVKTI